MASQVLKKTARAVIQRAYQISGILMPNEDTDADDTAFGIESLNELVSQWRNEKLWQYSISSQTFNCVAGKRSYTIGLEVPFPMAPQPDVIVPKLVIAINEARVLVGGQTWQPLREISPDDSYRTTVTPTANRLPYVFSYNRSMPWGTIDFLNGPDQSYPIQIVYSDYIPYYDLDDIIDLPDGYLNAFQLQLAVVLCDTYGVEPSGRLVQRAERAVDVIKTMNIKTNLLSMDVGPMRYNIYSDSYVVVGRGGL